MNWSGPMGNPDTGIPPMTPGESNLWPFIKLNADNNVYKKGNYYMLDSTYWIPSNPNSMRDQGLCWNAVYNFEPLAAPLNTKDAYYQGVPDFLTTAHDFHGEDEWWSYAHTHKGDSKAQGVINYRNWDLYSFGGWSPIKSAYQEANFDLDESASRGFHYYDNVIGGK